MSWGSVCVRNRADPKYLFLVCYRIMYYRIIIMYIFVMVKWLLFLKEGCMVKHIKIPAILT